MNYSLALKTTRLQAVVDAIGNGGKFRIHAARTAGSPNELGQLLCEIELGFPCGVVSGNVLVFSTPVSAIASVGSPAVVAAEGVIVNSSGVTQVDDISIGEEGSNSEATISESTIESGRIVTLTALIFAHP